MTTDVLKQHTRKELAEMARSNQISGWHGMRKDELVRALARQSRKRKNGQRKRTASAATNGKRLTAVDRNGTNGRGKNGRKREQAGTPIRLNHNLGRMKTTLNGTRRDSLVARVTDPYWIYAAWELTDAIVERAEAALGIEWRSAVPVIRVFDVTDDDSETSSARWVRDIEIHGQVDHWYVPVENPPRVYTLQIGFRTPGGKFFSLARSNNVQMPKPDSQDSSGCLETTAERAGRTASRRYKNGSSALEVQERLEATRKSHARSKGKSSNGETCGSVTASSFKFEIDAELILFGSTHPDAELTLLGERVQLSKTGKFQLRCNFPNGRQVIPAVTISPDGAEARTIVLAIERNSKELEPQSLDELMT